MPDQMEMLAAKLAAEAYMLQQAERLRDRANACAREYQSIVLSLEVARAHRGWAMAWIDLGALVVSLVFTAGGAIVARGTLRGVGVYATRVMPAAQAAAAAEQSAAAVRAAQTTHAMMIGKQLVTPAFLVHLEREFLVRVLAIGLPRTAAATALYGPFVVYEAMESGRPGALARLPVGKIGTIRRVHGDDREDQAIEVREDAVVRELQSLLRGLDPFFRLQLETPPDEWGSLVGALEGELMSAMAKDARFASLKEEARLFVRARALMDFWLQMAARSESEIRAKTGAIDILRHSIQRLRLAPFMTPGALNRAMGPSATY